MEMKLLGQIWTAVLNHIQMESHWLDYSFLRYVNSTMINLVQSLYQMGIQGNANKWWYGNEGAVRNK